MRLVIPILVQIAWTLGLLTVLGRARAAAVQRGEVRLREVALSGDAWPDRIKALGNNYANQFETPVLFYVLCGLALYTGATHGIMVALAWLYVASRIAHTLVHTGSNAVLTRFRAFIVGVAALAGMWIAIVLRLIS